MEITAKMAKLTAIRVMLPITDFSFESESTPLVSLLLLLILCFLESVVAIMSSTTTTIITLLTSE